MFTIIPPVHTAATHQSFGQPLRLAHRHGPWDCSAVGGAIIGDRVGNADSDRVATTPPAQRCRMVETW